ncbi:uncharacterized protein J3D65DRAFT_412081 [Phyllosticta citribraziliensis]|uniref:Uncharacterized protein n=1 Tax=Phyllosticta citribraziliensis TaxID=989973 RepID=A0ABR1LM61_9PEZI
MGHSTGTPGGFNSRKARASLSLFPLLSRFLCTRGSFEGRARVGGQAGVGWLLCYTGTVGLVIRWIWTLTWYSQIIPVTPSLLFLASLTPLSISFAWSACPVVTIYISERFHWRARHCHFESILLKQRSKHPMREHREEREKTRQEKRSERNARKTRTTCRGPFLLGKYSPCPLAPTASTLQTRK